MTMTLGRWLPWVLAPCVWACSSSETTPEPSPEPAVFDESAAERLQGAADSMVAQWGHPGTAVAAIDDEGAVWVGASGWWDPTAGVPLDASQVSKAGSITKTQVAAVVLQLVEEQVLSLDDTVASWWDGLPDGDTISVRDLLRHGSGLPDYLTFVEPVTELQRPWLATELVALVADEARLFSPGESYSYSNTNYVLLGIVIEAATGSAWQTAVQERLLAFLSLDDSTLPTDDWGEVGPGHIVLAGGQLYEPTTPDELRDLFHPSTLDAAGVLVADVDDLARWGRALWGSDSVLTEESRTQQLSDALPIGGTFSYGLGAVEVQDDWGQQIFHNGAVTGYVAWVGYRPEQRLTLAVLSNAWVDQGGTPGPDWHLEAVEDLWRAWLVE